MLNKTNHNDDDGYDGYILHKILYFIMIKLKENNDKVNIDIIQSLFDIKKKYFDLLNNIIEYHNNIQINKYILEYFKNFNQEEIFDTNTQIKLNKIFYNEIQSVNLINYFRTYDELKVY